MSKGDPIRIKQPPKPLRAPSAGAGRLAFTIDAAGQIEQVEAIDADGARRELSREERARLAGEKGALSLEAIVEKAFVAGIDYVLGEGDDGDDEAQSEAERTLLRPMLKHSSARGLIRPEVLRKALVADLVRRAVPARTAQAKAAGRSRRSTVGKA